jgi:hypothetical protein
VAPRPSRMTGNSVLVAIQKFRKVVFRINSNPLI